jgi:hypothetical protein
VVQPPPKQVGVAQATPRVHWGWPATPGGHSEVAAATSGSTVGGRPPTSLFQKIYGFFFIFFFKKKIYIM